MTTLPARMQKKLDEAEATNVALVGGQVQIQTLDEALKFCNWIARAPEQKRWKTPQDVLLAVQAGAELGLGPVQSLNALFPVQGTLGMMVKTQRSLVTKHGSLVGSLRDVFVLPDGEEVLDGDPKLSKITGSDLSAWPDALGARIYGQRKGWANPLSATFTVQDARRAKLWMKKSSYGESAWITYPKRMLRARAASLFFGDHFADVLLGLESVETLRDIPALSPTPSAPPPREQTDAILTEVCGGADTDAKTLDIEDAITHTETADAEEELPVEKCKTCGGTGLADPFSDSGEACSKCAGEGCIPRT